MGSFFDWRLVIEYFPKVLNALPVTLAIVGVATVVGLFLGVIIAFIRIEKVIVLSQISAVFVSFIRGTPILVQMFIVYYGLPQILILIGIDANQWDKIYYLYAAYGLNTGAFLSETVRAAILSVPESQSEAALACGLSKGQMYFKIIFPQAIRVGLPNFGTTVISLLQDTSLAFTIGVIDVVGKARAIGSVTFHTIEAYVDAAIIFVILSFILEKLFSLLEQRMDFAARAAVPLKKNLERKKVFLKLSKRVGVGWKKI